MTIWIQYGNRFVNLIRVTTWTNIEICLKLSKNPKNLEKISKIEYFFNNKEALWYYVVATNGNTTMSRDWLKREMEFHNLC